MITKGIKSANQVQFQDQNGNPTVPVIGAKGGMLVEIADGELDALEATTLFANVMAANIEEQTIGVGGKKVTTIGIVNYGEEAKVTVDVDGKSFVIGPNVATELLINKVVTTVGISATADGTNVQYVIKGIEGAEA